MRRTARAAFAVGVVAALCAIPALATSGARSADPGVTSTSILLGGTSPLTGRDAAYAAVTRGAKAYFDSVNAKGGVSKRRVDYKILDDAYDPAETVQATRRLVEQDKVFAIFNSLGTEQNLAVREYLNRAKVPQLFVSSGATTFGRDTVRFPWTIGFQPSYQAEGWVYGQYVGKTRKRAKVGVLFQDDDYGRDLLRGLERGLARSGSKVTAAEPYNESDPDVQSQIAQLKASGANVLAIFATSKFAVQSYVFANRLGWRPLVVVSAMSAASSVMRLASDGGRNKTITGSISMTFLKDPDDQRWNQDPGVRQYRSIMSRYAKGANASDAHHLYGMAAAYETVKLLERVGANATRARLMAMARSMRDPSNPFLLPGISVQTGKADGFPVQQVQLQQWTRGRWAPFGGLWASKRL